MNKLKEKSTAVYKKTREILKEKRGDIGTAGKILIGCIVVVAILGITVFLMNWTKDKVEDTTRQVDTEYSKWSN